MEVITPAERTLTEIDHARLMRLVRQAAGTPGAGAMQEMLENSDLVTSPEVPANVITMYSQVLLQDALGGEPYKITLCYPADAEPAAGFVSVLSPVGMALLGLRLGDLARWSAPGGHERTARVLEVLFQPEATGDYQT